MYWWNRTAEAAWRAKDRLSLVTPAGGEGGEGTQAPHMSFQDHIFRSQGEAWRGRQTVFSRVPLPLLGYKNFKMGRSGWSGPIRSLLVFIVLRLWGRNRRKGKMIQRGRRTLYTLSNSPLTWNPTTLQEERVSLDNTSDLILFQCSSQGFNTPVMTCKTFLYWAMTYLFRSILPPPFLKL